MNKISDYLSKRSKSKFEYILKKNPVLEDNVYQNLHPVILRNIEVMKDAFKQKIIMDIGSTNLNYMTNTFEHFVRDVLSQRKNKFLIDLHKMKNIFPVTLSVGPGYVSKLRINFIFNKKKLESYQKHISLIIHAISTFCWMNPYKYDGLEINICLDNNHRDIPKHINNMKVSDKIKYLRNESLGLVVSGVTYPAKKIINLTKTEEIIKLLFHEMIHFIELDHVLLNYDFFTRWSVKSDQSNMNLSEAYTEFISVILSSIYQSIHLSYLTENSISIEKMVLNTLAIESEYSIYLSAKILQFYQFDQKNCMSFFNGTSKKIYQPILIWEYIFLRGILFQNINEILNSIPYDLRLDHTNAPQLENILHNDTVFANKVCKYMTDPQLIESSVSYLAMDIDWSKI